MKTILTKNNVTNGIELMKRRNRFDKLDCSLARRFLLNSKMIILIRSCRSVCIDIGTQPTVSII